jgi:uncharacterized protein (DUF697 family)
MNSYVTKKWYESKTIIGVVVIVISQIGSIYGYNVDEQAQKDLVEVLSTLGTAVGSVMALVGRLKAQKKIQ